MARQLFTQSGSARRPHAFGGRVWKGFLVAVLACLSMTGIRADRDGDEQASARIGRHNWGAVVSPVFGTSQSGTYDGAELFAAPNQFDGFYYHGVLPSGRIVRPAGITVQVGSNPLGARLTPDGKFLITSNDDEREGGLNSLKTGSNKGGYSLTVLDAASMAIVSSVNTGRFFIGLQITGTGPYTVWASGGPDNDVKLFNLSTAGAITAGSPAHIPIAPILPANRGYVSNYTPSAAFNMADGSGNKPPVPTGFDRVAGAQTTFPAGSALSPDGKFLYVACNGDNSLAVIDTTTKTVVRHVRVGYFPYDVAVSGDGSQVFVSNWGVTAYTFANPTYDNSGVLTAIGVTAPNEPAGYFVPKTSTHGERPKTSSVSIIDVPDGDATGATPSGSIYLGHRLDALFRVGDTHPSATAIVAGKHQRVLYVTRSNSDSLALIKLASDEEADQADQEAEQTDSGEVEAAQTDSPVETDLLAETDAREEGGGQGDGRDGGRVKVFDLALLHVGGVRPAVHGSYPNAIVASPDGKRVYVAEAGINSVAVLDTTHPMRPRLLGRIGTGWYPTALALSPNGKTLYVVNAKGIGEDLGVGAAPPSTSAAPFTNIDSNYIFGSAQRVNLANTPLDGSVAHNNFSVASDLDTSVVPIGGEPSKLIKHVFFILHENKTFDSMLGGEQAHFGPYASTTYFRANGSTFTDQQFVPVALNTQLLSRTFAAGVNYYSDSEESDAGHQFAMSGTTTDYSEKTLLVKSGRGLLVNKNFDPEDYPEAGYIFNNAARNHVSFKEYGVQIRITGTDTGSSTPTILNDPPSGKAGYPTSPMPLMNVGDVDSPTQGLGQSYFMTLPSLAVVGTLNASGEPRIDHNYPGYNFNISDQRRAQEFIKDFDRMVANDSLPRFVYIYQPNDHTGGTQATNVPAPTAPQQVNDCDVALGMVVKHIMNSPVYYDATSGEGSAIFMTYDDAQATLDHIHPHRTPVLVVSPYAKPGYLGKKHYDTASVVKTEELLLGLPPSNLGDMLATDLRDLFTPVYNGITADMLTFNLVARYEATPEGRKVWALVKQLDTSAPDRDSHRLGALGRLSMAADQLHTRAAADHKLGTAAYRQKQRALYAEALAVVKGPAPRDTDD